MRENEIAMTARLEALEESEVPDEQPHHGKLSLVAKWAALVAVVAAAIFLVVWSEGAEQRAIREMPAVERQALLTRTLQNLRTVCSAPAEAMHDYCSGQARLALEFSECDHDCEALAYRQISRLQMPR